MELGFSGPGWYMFQFDVPKRKEFFHLMLSYFGPDWSNQTAAAYGEKLVYVYSENEFWDVVTAEIAKFRN